jgi:hypothetical protein
MAFDHVAHIRLAIDCIETAASLDEATAQMAAILRDKAEQAGVPGKYHETVTRFWMHMVARVLDKDLPKAYYSEAALASDAARTGWLDPDLRPLDQ